MNDTQIEQLARELARELPFPPEDWEAIVAQAKRIRDTVQTLDELPLDNVEPAFLFPR